MNLGNRIINQLSGIKREIIQHVVNSNPLINLISDEPKRIVNLLLEAEEEIKKTTVEVAGRQIIKIGYTSIQSVW